LLTAKHFFDTGKIVHRQDNPSLATNFEGASLQKSLQFL
jgi:hypothetical protein